MLRATPVVAAILLLLAPALPAQRQQPRTPRGSHSIPPAAGGERSLDATGLGSPLPLDRRWLVGISSDPAAATPQFDDSGWALRDATESIPDVPGGGDESSEATLSAHRYVWFRLHIRLPEDPGPLALLVELPPAHQNSEMAISSSGVGVEPGLEVFVDGRPVRPLGVHGDAPFRYKEISRIYPVSPEPGQTTLTLAVRTLYVPVGSYAYTNFFARHSFRLGHPEDLGRALDLWIHHGIFERLPKLINGILLLVLAVFLLALYLARRDHVEYLWLALFQFAQAPISFLDMAAGMAHVDELWYIALVLQLIVISAYLFFEFLVSFLGLRRRWYITLPRYAAPILLGVGPAILLVGGHGWLLVLFLAVVLLGSLLWIGGWFLFIFITLISATLRRNFEAGLLLLPLLLNIIGIAEPMLAGSMSDLEGRPYQSPLTLQIGPVPIHFASIADFAGLLAIMLIIFVRFLRIQSDRERAKSELAAARSVQELMIPQEKLETPGYQIDSVYRPANEVGGDFYYVEPSSDGGLLVVIGDVAGKGLEAAMNVSMLVGVLRGCQERSPARILASLNRVLSGNDSLTTCQAVRFAADGELVMASAGHLPPYLNSQEIALPGGLPLGALPEVAYDEVRLYVHPGDRLLLLSDGVVEARRSTGELFGFERVHRLSTQPALSIAEAARAFGQQDDITVLTVRRLAGAAA